GMNVSVRAALVVALLLALATWAAPSAAQPKARGPTAGATKPQAESCATCHLETGDERLVKPARAYPQDVHQAKGFGCAACHGGDGKAEGMGAMDPAEGYIGKPERSQVIQVCGRCHADARFMKQYNPSLRVDQVAEYATSVHGRRLRELNDPKVAVCTSCHPAHAIRPKSDPASSVHPLKVAETCARCHADATYMTDYKIPTDQFQKYTQSVHWKTMTVKGDLAAPTCNSCHGNHGAAPPGVSWVGNVCGQCHTLMDTLQGEQSRASAILERAEHAGMEVSQARFELNGANDALVKALAAVHAFSVEAVRKETEPGLAISAKAHARGQRALEELRFRR